MPDLLASIQIPPLAPVLPLRAVPMALPAVTGFAAALDELLLPKRVPGGEAERQGDATGGKDLPEDRPTDDPLIAWMFVPPPPAPVPAPPPLPVPFAAAGTAVIDRDVESSVSSIMSSDDPVPTIIEMPQDSADRPIEAGPAGVGQPVVTPALASTSLFPSIPAATVPPLPLPEMAISVRPVPTQVVAAPGPLAQAAPAVAPVPAASGTTPLPAPDTAVAPPPAPLADPSPAHFDDVSRPIALRPIPNQPVIIPLPSRADLSPSIIAGQVFAVALSVAAQDHDPANPSAPAVLTGATAGPEHLRQAVQAMAGADHTPLDLDRNDWPARMIERIATLRDTAEAADTRIRLAPEHLGAIDVSIRREGDRIHVTFSAENPATRQMLADATPRLAELAEARGVRLGHASVDAGTGGGQHGTQQQPATPSPQRAAFTASDADSTETDGRIA